MKTLNIKKSHFDFDFVDLELKSGKENVLVNLFNSENFHPSWLIDNQLTSIVKQIDSFYKKQKGSLKKEFEILISIMNNGKLSYMVGFMRIS